MSEQKTNPISDLLKVIAKSFIAAGIELAEEKIIKLLHPHKKSIAHAAVPITEDVAAATQCPDSQVWDGTQCVTAPVPPDPTHPKP